MRVLVFLVLSLLLAGCFTNGSAGTHSTSATGTTTTQDSSGSTVHAPATTDLIRFQNAPNLTTVAPRQIRAIRVPVYSPLAATSVVNLKPSVWNFTWQEDRSTEIRWNLTGWVDVEGVVLGPTSVPPNANGTYPFWSVFVDMQAPGATPGDDSKIRSSSVMFWEPQAVPNGVRELKASLVLPAAAFSKGWLASIGITTLATFVAPDATIDLLTASTQYDSRIQVAGAQLPSEVPKLALETT